MKFRFFGMGSKKSDDEEEDEEEKKRKREEELKRRAKEKPRENKGYFGEGAGRGKMLKQIDED